MELAFFLAKFSSTCFRSFLDYYKYVYAFLIFVLKLATFRSKANTLCPRVSSEVPDLAFQS